MTSQQGGRPGSSRWLLRLYPRSWRARYCDEFTALIESSPLTPRVMLDVAAGAIVQRWRAAFEFSGPPTTLRSLIEPIAAPIAAAWLMTMVASFAAEWLAGFPVTARIREVNGVTMVSPPWPSFFLLVGPLMQFVVLVRCFGAIVPLVQMRPLLGRELRRWYLALFVTSVCWLYGDRLVNVGTGLPPRNDKTFIAIQLALQLLFLHICWWQTRRAQGLDPEVSAS